MTMTSIRRILAVILLTAGLTACGLKGDLYLEEPEEPAVAPEAAPAEPEATDDEAADTEAPNTDNPDDEMSATETPEAAPEEADAAGADSVETPAADDAS
jgi:predicted small lipoprotein YifL